MRRLTIEEVRKAFEARGFKLLSTEYHNKKTPLEYICPKGHKGTTTWDSFGQGHGCKQCARENISEERKELLRRLADEKRKNIDDVREEFERHGFTLLSTEYKNCMTRLKYVCPNGHVGETTYKSFHIHHACKQCSDKKAGEKAWKDRKRTIEEVRKIFENRGFKLLSTEYINNKQKLEYICPEGHLGRITLNSFLSGGGCRICSNKKKGKSSKNIKRLKELTKKQRVSWDRIVKGFAKVGLELLSAEEDYINQFTKLKFKCKNGHIGETTWDSIRNGRGCKICGIQKVKKALRRDLNEVISFIEDNGYKVLNTEKFENTKSKLLLGCPQGHTFLMHFNSFQQGHRCPICSKSISKEEIELTDTIKKYFPDLKSRDRQLISPYELDIVIPSKNVAIEYCGIYWHSEQQGKDKDYHLNKLRLCNELGYNLITVFSDEYINKKDVVISRILNKLGKSPQYKVYARDCVIEEINPTTKRDFLNKYHLQGNDKSKVRLGLKYGDRLVSVMTFSYGSISKGNKPKENEYELSRFCSRHDVLVVGGASKLLKYFIDNYNPNYIFSYADRRWSNGELYYKLGFELVGETPPNYWYVLRNRRFHRFGFRKSELPKRLETFDPNLTEYQNMLNNGYDRIWDCGSLKFKLKL